MSGKAKTRAAKSPCGPPPFVPCTAHRLPPDVPAEEVIANALAADPRNGVWVASAVALAGMPAAPMEPLRIAAVVQKLWPAEAVRRMPVSFLGNPSAELRRKALQYANLLSGGGAAVEFVESADGLIRVAFDPRDGHYSYLGVDAKLIRPGAKTMNLALSLSSPESEWLRVGPHEFLHALGAPHEHARPEIVARLDPDGCYAYFRRYGWSRETVNQQVLTPLDPRTLTGTPASVVSAMAYQFPAECVRDRQPIPGGTRPTADDLAFLARLYPGQVQPPPPPAAGWKYTLSIDPASGSPSIAKVA